MKVQLVGFGNVGKSLAELLLEKRRTLKSLGLDIFVVSVSDSKGTAIDGHGLDLDEVLECKKRQWNNCNKYKKDYAARDAIKQVQSDVVVELTPSTFNGEPGLSNIETALKARKNVVTANKGALVTAFRKLVKLARDNGVQLFYEATVAAHVPIFCMVDSCFKADEVLKIEGILNATTNFIIDEIEKGNSFDKALNKAIQDGWTETDYSDDIDGIDAARKAVVLANSLFRREVKLEDVVVKGIRQIEAMISESRRSGRKVKLVCEIKNDGDMIKISVMPRQVSLDDPLATVNRGNMGLKFTFKTCGEVFVSAQFTGTMQTAYAVLNDIVRTAPSRICR